MSRIDRSIGKVRKSDEWMRGSSLALRGALLALVLERPDHGYALASRLTDRLGSSWLIVRNDIYRLLDGLVEDGLLSLREEWNPGRRRSRFVYHPTELTVEAVNEWMATLIPREPIRMAIRAKVAVAREQDARPLLLALRAYEQDCLRLLQLTPIAAGVSSWEGLLIDCTREATDVQLRCEVEWARRTRHRIEEFLARGR